MAACILRQMAAERGMKVIADSAATSREESGAGIYPPARKKLKQEGVPLDDHRARQMTREDYEAFDFLFAMDSANIRNMVRISGGDPSGKIARLLDSTPHPRDIADPWYTGDFDATFRDLMEGCEALLDRLSDTK